VDGHAALISEATESTHGHDHRRSNGPTTRHRAPDRPARRRPRRAPRRGPARRAHPRDRRRLLGPVAFGGDSSGAAQSSSNANVQRSAPPSGPSTWRDAKKTFGLLDPRTGAAAASGARFRVDALGALKWSLKLDFPTRSADDTLEVTAVCRRVDGGQSFSQKVSVHVNAGQESANITGQVGASSSASWSPGRYRVEMSIDGQRVWQTEFDAYADEPVPEAKRSQPDRPSPRPAERVNRANKAAAERALDQ
jgi:hypothetical protein